ncbi:MAG: hypothetical protein N3I35_07180 [Clostridia bacterium]|nr:hypothetical protein [Clostridia bacterium]
MLENIEDIIIPIAGCLTAITIVVTVQVSKYKLKVEQIKADALVRAEEIKAKNQLELERLIRVDHQKSKYSDSISGSDDSRTVREKINNQS